ncbi:LIM domain-binding protein 1-A [Labeo rohita]|uniref:LIM domain-binding protein 1-A n=1 Tax=Labeo rohita TaxID=84645 RepID=A0ABQ8M4Q2_LABRO|nr:LIM domain-binding protein 1-A [Labeo rohita]
MKVLQCVWGRGGFDWGTRGVDAPPEQGVLRGVARRERRACTIVHEQEQRVARALFLVTPLSPNSDRQTGIISREHRERERRIPVWIPAGCSSKSFKLYSPKEPPNGSAFPPFHPGAMLDRDVGPTPMYPPSYMEPGIGIFELNKRLQNWTEQDCDNLWWDAFTTEFFEDDAMLTITFCLEDGPKRYTIGRTLIPRYFRSIFEGGATELFYVLKHPKESFHNNFVSLDCDQCTMVTQNGKPMFTQVCVEGRLYLEFMFDDMMRIKTWHFSIRQHREVVPRSILAMHAQDPQMLDQLSKNITRCGLSNSTLNYLRLCVILEPMQELMSRHKTYSLSPRDCLKTSEPARQAPNKRRKRKMSGGSTMSSGGGNNTNNSNSKKKSPASSFALSSQDVMVVGEPTLMGGEFGDEDERLITRLENTQFDAANGIDDEDSFNSSPALGTNSPWNSKAPSSQESKNDNPTSQSSQTWLEQKPVQFRSLRTGVENHYVKSFK